MVPRQRIDAACGILGILDFGEDFAGAIEEQRSAIRCRDAPRRSQQELHAEPALQFADDARYRGL
jgi:hypothetical protein